MDELFRLLPDYLGGHLQISLTALALGIGISLPLAVLVARCKPLRWPVLSAAGVIQTIPSLALLALMYPLLGRLGFVPAVAALTLYSMLPIVRNTVTGIAGIDPAIVEAARGVGMTPSQQLFKVQLPLAMPVIVAGVRTATVWVVGIATLATPIGQVCLGNYIFKGLDLRQWDTVLFGCAVAAALALMLDGLIAQIETAAKRSQPARAWAAGATLAAVLVAGLALPQLDLGGSRLAAARDGEGGEAMATLTVGSKNFTEQYILSNLIADHLAAAGFGVELTQNLGSGVVFQALADGDIDCYVDYSGTIWLTAMKASGPADRRQVLEQVSEWVEKEQGIRCLGSLGFENTYALAMPRKLAERYGIKTITDLAEHADELKIGGTSEFFGRAEWRNLRDEYGLNFDRQIELNPTLMYEAAASGDVDVISGFSTDGRIAAYDLVVLTDPKQVIPPYDAIVLVGPKLADDEQVIDALQPLIGAISVPLMQQTNLRVDRDEDADSPAEAAKWLGQQIQADD